MPTTVLLGQIRGTEYAVLEIVWWMLAAALVGALIGWMIRGFSKARRVERHYAPLVVKEQQRAVRLETELDAAKSEHRSAQAEVEAVRDQLAEANRRSQDLEADLAAVRAAIPPEPAPPGGPMASLFDDEPFADRVEQTMPETSDGDPPTGENGP